MEKEEIKKERKAAPRSSLWALNMLVWLLEEAMGFWAAFPASADFQIICSALYWALKQLVCLMAAESKLVMRQVRVHDAAVHGGSEVTRQPKISNFGKWVAWLLPCFEELIYAAHCACGFLSFKGRKAQCGTCLISNLQLLNAIGGMPVFWCFDLNLHF